jgi:zinc-ribbon domain
MSSQLVGALLALGLGYWAYTDSKALAQRGIRVGKFSPLAWGFGVALVAILFGVLYLRQRSRAVRAGSPSLAAGGDSWLNRPPPPPSSTTEVSPPREPRERDPFCRSCGHELPTYVSSFCPKCGRAL